MSLGRARRQRGSSSGGGGKPQRRAHPWAGFLAAVTTRLRRPWARLLQAGVQVAVRSCAAIVSSLQVRQQVGSGRATRDLHAAASLPARFVLRAKMHRDDALRHPFGPLPSPAVHPEVHNQFRETMGWRSGGFSLAPPPPPKAGADVLSLRCHSTTLPRLIDCRSLAVCCWLPIECRK